MSWTESGSKREPADTLHSLAAHLSSTPAALSSSTPPAALLSPSHFTTQAPLDVHWLWHILEPHHCPLSPPHTRPLAQGRLSLLLTSIKTARLFMCARVCVSQHAERQTKSGKQTDWQTGHLLVGFLDFPNTVFFVFVFWHCAVFLQVLNGGGSVITERVLPEHVERVTCSPSCLLSHSPGGCHANSQTLADFAPASLGDWENREEVWGGGICPSSKLGAFFGVF